MKKNRSRKAAMLLMLNLLLSGCGEAEESAAGIRERLAQPCEYSAAARVSVEKEDDILQYSLRADALQEETVITVLDPPELAGITAHLSRDALSLEYDGLVLDASGALGKLSAVNCIPLCLRAAGEGYLLEQGRSALGDTETVRLCIESECSGEMLQYDLWFDGQDIPLYAEITKNGENVIKIEFTSFAYGDIIPKDAVQTALH